MPFRKGRVKTGGSLKGQIYRKTKIKQSVEILKEIKSITELKEQVLTIIRDFGLHSKNPAIRLKTAIEVLPYVEMKIQGNNNAKETMPYVIIQEADIVLDDKAKCYKGNGTIN